MKSVEPTYYFITQFKSSSAQNCVLYSLCQYLKKISDKGIFCICIMFSLASCQSRQTTASEATDTTAVKVIVSDTLSCHSHIPARYAVQKTNDTIIPGNIIETDNPQEWFGYRQVLSRWELITSKPAKMNIPNIKFR
jgi:hypothetical protein